MKREKELYKNTIILGIGSFLPKFVSIITLPIVTACLTKSEYGTFDLINTLVMLLIPIATLQIQTAAFRFLVECRGDYEKSCKIITNIFLVTILAASILSIVISVFMSSFSVNIRYMVALYFWVDCINITISQVVRGLGKNGLYSFSSILCSVTNGIGVFVALKILNLGLWGAIISLVISSAISLLTQFFYAKVYCYIKIQLRSLKQIKELLAFSWPMIPNNLSSWVLKLSDRLVITAFLGIEANAVYAVANKIPNLLSIAQSVFVMAWQENASLAVKDKDADKYFTKMFDKIFSLMIGFTALLIGFNPVIFKLLIKGEYADAYIQIPILILGMFFYCMSAFQGGIYIAHKKTKSVGITTIVAAAINLVIDLLFVNLIGITAGSLSTLIAYVVLYIYRLFDSLKFQPMDYKIKKQFILLSVIVVMLLLCFMQNWWFNIINAFMGIIYCSILNIDLIKIVFKKN